MKMKCFIVLFSILRCLSLIGLPHKDLPLIGVIATKIQAESVAKGNIPIKLADILHSIERTGGVPIILSPLMDQGDLNDKFAIINGLVIPGGADIDPTLYGDTPDISVRSTIEGADKSFDLFELDLLQKAIQKQIAVLGICRGLQLINVYFGGTLYHDLPTQYKMGLSVIHRKRIDGISQPTFHHIKILENTLLHQISITSTVNVNSYHHQSIKQLGSSLKVSALAEDGVIEGIERVNSDEFKIPPILGVQFHPERGIEESPFYISLFTYLNFLAIQ